jgi:hypothetical protein
VHRPVRDSDTVRQEPRPLPDLLMYYLLRKADGSELAAKYEVDHRLQLLRDRDVARRGGVLVTPGVRSAYPYAARPQC